MKDCPAPQTLLNFALGNLSRGSWDGVAVHVEGCSTCETALADLDQSEDPLIRELGSSDDHDDAIDGVPRPLLRAAQSIADSEAGSSARSELVSDPGRSLALQLEQGRVHLGRFELLEKCGVGSFGYVFRAHDTELQRTVAIKVQRTGRFASQDERDRFLREARSAAQLEHPFIVSLHETGQAKDGACYLVSEFVEGETLENLIAEGAVPAQRAAEIIAHLAQTLQYAHEQGVIHRDIKPSNILLDRQGQPHIMDFGLAKWEAGDATMTPEGEVLGTPAYMSPEQAAGHSHDVDPRSDIYSLAVLLYELLTSERPFQGNRRMLLLQVLEDEPRPPRRLNDRVPRKLETVCLKAMAKSPARRYSAAGEFAEDLRRFLRGDPVAAREVSRIERGWWWCRRNPIAAGLLAAATLGPTIGLIHLSTLSEQLVQETALQSARMQAEVLEEMNNLYSDIVQRMEGHDVPITHEYATREGALPLPATFTIEAGRRISAAKTGMQVRLYSDFPFPWRKDSGPQDEFERQALRQLERHPEQAVHEFTEYAGRPYLRFATARRMQESCLKCHNHHPKSPKKDWQVGDVRGVLEIMRPLEQDMARTREGLQGTASLVGTIAVLLGGLSVLVLVVSRKR